MKMSVIPCDRREARDLRTNELLSSGSMRRSFDSGLRPALRMTMVDELRCVTIPPIYDGCDTLL